MFSFRSWFAAIVLTSCFSGCNNGPKLYKISGRVEIDGKPLTYGYVWVIPENDRSAGGDIQSDGSFTLTSYVPGDGVVAGKHRVTVTATKPLSPTKIRHEAPTKYRDAETSGLSLEVSAAKKDVVIPLTWDGGQPFVQDVMADGDVSEAK